MAIDTSRAILVSQEYRYAAEQDLTILAKAPDAREIVMQTNLEAAAAATRATALFNQCKTPAKVFEVAVRGVYYLEDMKTSPPRFIANFGKHEAAGTTTTYTVIAIKDIDYLNDRCVLVIRA